jgi:23S rRNA (uracil1939-C5)-methyltransferase
MQDDTLVITLSALAFGGDAVGRVPEGDPRAGLAVFVPYALPGETVRLRLLDVKRGHARGELLEVLVPSPERVTPRCPHFFTPQSEITCGGCHYQHLSYPAQLAAKAVILRDQLERIGGLKDPAVLPAVASPYAWNYRNHVQFHLTLQGKLGFEAHRSHRVIPIRECHLPEATINQLWPRLELEPLPGLERVSLRVGAGEEMMLILEGGDPQSFELIIEELPISAVHLGPAGPLVMAGNEALDIEVEAMRLDPGGSIPGTSPLRRSFRVSADSFFQVNTSQAGEMVTHLLSNLPLDPSTTLLDVYCGVGLFSAFLASRVGRLIGIEISPSACQDFELNLSDFDNVELYEAAAEETLPALDIRPDVILVDPPRAGLGLPALDGLNNLGPSTLAYVSCDPATLARDARRLVANGYHLRQITPFDLFPQTYHIESISFWDR